MGTLFFRQMYLSQMEHFWLFYHNNCYKYAVQMPTWCLCYSMPYNKNKEKIILSILFYLGQILKMRQVKIRLVNWWNRKKFMNYGELLVLILWVESCKAVPAGRTSAPFLVLDWFPSVSPTTIVHVWSIVHPSTTVVASPYLGWGKRLLNKKLV